MLTKAAASPVVRTITYGVLGLSLTILVTCIFLFVRAQQKMSYEFNLIQTVELFQSRIVDIETSYRGYLIIAADRYLEPYNRVLAEYPATIADLRARAKEADIPPEKIDALIGNADKVIDFAKSILAARQLAFDDARALMDQGLGKLLMDQVRQDVSDLRSLANRKVAELTEAQTRRYLPLALFGFLGVVLTSALLANFAKRSRETTLKARSLLTTVIERAPVGLALVDQTQVINQLNPAFAHMLDIFDAKPAGKPLSAVAPALADLIGGKISTAIQRIGELSPLRETDKPLEVLTESGSRYFRADVFHLTLLDADGRPGPGAGIVLTDITAQREWELELEEARDAAQTANRAKSAFIANMSHELRTPLTAVLGYCELIEEDLQDLGQESVLADLAKINVNARHLLGLINDVLDLSKIEAQKMDVSAVEFTVGSLLQEIEAATGSLMNRNNNVMAVTVEAPDVVMHTDDLKLRQVLLNIISNAAKFTHEGTISLSVKPCGSEAARPCTQFVIADTGIGMSPEQLEGLFKRFNQADETTTRKYGGTGLGLALTRSLTQILGGQVSVSSELGKGTTFTVTIPNHYEKPTEAQAAGTAPVIIESAESPPVAFEAGGTVLIVDDESAARELLQRHLTKEGFRVLSARSGTEALELLKTVKPVAVLLDVMMPGMDGWHVLRAIRQNPETAAIPVIMQTILDEENFAYTLGASAFLKKPVNRSELAETLATVRADAAARHVLIVDDDRTANERLRRIFQHDGWEVSLANSGAQALKLLETRAKKLPDVVLVDLIMPEMDGYELVRQISNNPAWAALTVVVMTAEDVESAKVRSLADRAGAIVQKGAAPLSALVADLRRLAGNRDESDHRP